MITCYMAPTTGKILLEGLDVDKEPEEIKKKIGYLPENNPLYTDMAIIDYLKFCADIQGVEKSIVNERIHKMVDLCGLNLERHKRIGELSKGYRQRVGLAQAMIHDPEVLVLDEPTTGLDPNQIIEIRKLIKELGKEKTVILSSHILSEVEATCDRILIINKGKIVADDSTANLQNRIGNEIIVTVEFKQSVDRALLKAIRGVKNYEQLKDGKWNFVSEGSKDLREDIFNFAKEKNLTLLSLYKEESSLEDVFKQLTR